MIFENFEFLNDIELEFEGMLVSLKAYYEFAGCLAFPLERKVSLNFDPCYPTLSANDADFPVTLEFLDVERFSTNLNFSDMQPSTGGHVGTGYKEPDDEDMSYFHDQSMASKDDHFIVQFDPFGYIRIGAQSCRLVRRAPVFKALF